MKKVKRKLPRHSTSTLTRDRRYPCPYALSTMPAYSACIMSHPHSEVNQGSDTPLTMRAYMVGGLQHIALFTPTYR
jgi:hypothetical protein